MFLVWGECSHVFHMHCLLKWIGTVASKQQCPMDRRAWGMFVFIERFAFSPHFAFLNLVTAERKVTTSWCETPSSYSLCTTLSTVSISLCNLVNAFAYDLCLFFWLKGYSSSVIFCNHQRNFYSLASLYVPPGSFIFGRVGLFAYLTTSLNYWIAQRVYQLEQPRY